MFGAKIEARPGQANGPGQVFIWHILSIISFVVCQTSVVSLPFVAYRSFHSHRLQKRRRNDAARLIQAVYRGWYVRRSIQNLKRKVRHTLHTEPQTQGTSNASYRTSNARYVHWIKKPNVFGRYTDLLYSHISQN